MTRSQYRAMLKQDGETQRDRVVNKALHDTRFLAPVNPSYKEVTIDDVPRWVNIISSTVTNQKIFRTRPGEDFEIGSIMYWGKSHWLITERDADDEITVRGRIQICQKQIVWQDDQTKKIVSLWATVEKPYYSNLSENKVMSYSTREFRIQTPFDEYSARLNIGKRLMLEIVNGEPKTYRITSITYPDDNIVDDRVLSIEFTGEPSIPTGGFGKLFTAKIDGEVYDGAEWTLTGDCTPAGVCFKGGNTTTTGAKCKITCVDDSKLIGQVVVLTVKAAGLTEKIELEVI